jgi:hypothetical protein
MLKMYIDPMLVLDQRILVDHYKDCARRREETIANVVRMFPAETVAQAFTDGTTVTDATQKILNSNPKFASVLEQLGVEPPMKPSKADPEKMTYAFAKTDVEFKELLEHPDERVQAIVAARLGTKSTIEESRTEAFMRISRRGTLPILLNYYGAHTGRASGGDKINLQNLPRGGNLRKAILAPPGFKLVVGDSSQIEARMNAWFSFETELVQAFADGEDIYSQFASDVYGYEVSKALKIERHVGKTSILGLGYGMGPPKFKFTLKTGQISVEMDLERCKDVVNLYRRKYSRIKANWKTCEQMLHDILNGTESYYGPGGCVKTCADGIILPNGMLVRYPGLRQTDDGFEYQSRGKWIKLYGAKVVENLIQALARIVVFDQMIMLAKRYKVVLTVHDEIVLCVPEDQVGEAVRYMEEVMSIAPSWATGLPIACEVGSGSSYGDAK